MKKMRINEFAKLVHTLAKEKGWHNDREETVGQFIERACNNLHNEVSELHEAYRNHRLYEFCDKADEMKRLGQTPLTCMEEELADVVIRAFDGMIRLGVNPEQVLSVKHRYNATRSYRHGGKAS